MNAVGELYRRLEPEAQKQMEETFRKAARTRGDAECVCRMPSRDGEPSPVRLELRYWGANESAAILFALFEEAPCI